MFEFAQTNLQLYRQMDEQGYCHDDREQVARAYRLLMPMFSGFYRGTEKPFITHLTGTASILVSGKMPLELVLAGLLHAAYMSGDFGFQPGTRQTQRKRGLIREEIGEAAESIIAAYDSSRWNLDSVRTWRTESYTPTDLERSVLRLHLANILEDFLDYGMSYCAGQKLEKIAGPEMQRGMLGLAHTYSWPGLANHLEQALESFNDGKTAVEPSGFMGKSALILPPSAGKGILIRAQGFLFRVLRRLKNYTG